MAVGETTTPGPGVATPLSVKITGPSQHVVGESARFIIEVANTGTTPLKNLTVVERFDPALRPTYATEGHRVDNGNLVWTIESLAAGKSTQLEVLCACQAAAAKACNRVSVTTPDGGRAESEACLEIRAPGARPPETTPAAPAGEGLAMDVVGLRSPVAAGKDLFYEIRVTNNGPASYRQVQVAATVPEGMLFDPLGTVGPGPTKFSREGQVIRFDPVFEVRPGESVVYSVHVRTKQPGQYRFRAELNASGLLRPLSKEASTEVF